MDRIPSHKLLHCDQLSGENFYHCLQKFRMRASLAPNSNRIKAGYRGHPGAHIGIWEGYLSAVFGGAG